MIFEIFEIFWTAKIELRVIILAILIGSCFWYWQENKRKKKEQHQERLNQMDLDDEDESDIIGLHIEAETIEAAIEMAQKCPHLDIDGTIEIAPIMMKM